MNSGMVCLEQFPSTALPSLASLGIDGESQTERPQVLTVLSSILERLLAVTEQKFGSSSGSSYGSQKLTVFHGLRAPTISIDKYLDRIYKYSNCSPSCFVVAYILLDRIVQRHPDMPVTSLNVHRLLISSVMVAAKFLDDA